MDSKLHPWVSNELDGQTLQENIITEEEFSFLILPNQEIIFKWNAAKTGNYKFVVDSYEIVDKRDVIRL